MLLPQEIAEQLTPEEYMDIAATVEEAWHQSFGIERVTRIHRQIVVEISLDDETRHEIVLGSK